MRVRLAILTAALLALPATSPVAWLAPSAAAQNFDAERIIADQTAALTRTLTAPGVEAPARLAAARKLLAIGRAEQRTSLRFVLTDTNPSNTAARLAVAVALAGDAQPDPQFVDPLFALLDPQSPRELLEPAADALGLFKSSPDVATRLLGLTAGGRDDSVRLAAVRGLRYLAEKRVAARLAELTNDPSPAVASEAIASLRGFALLDFDSPAEWGQWFRNEQDKPDAQFRDDVLSARAALLDRARRGADEVTRELGRRLNDQYNRAARDDKPALLRGYLTHRSDAVRAAGVELYESLARTGDAPEAVSGLLPELLADSSADVRLFAARTMQWLNAASAFDAMSTQLAVERDAAVKVELIKAIAVQKNAASVALLRPALDDPSPRVANAAIRGISDLAETLHKSSPTLARELSIQLQAIFESRTKPNENLVTRELAVEALAKLRSTRATVFRELLTRRNPQESVGIRRFASIGLGNTGDPNVAPLLVEALQDDSPSVRSAAIQAIGELPADSSTADALLARCDPNREKDARVREDAWTTFKKVMPGLPESVLAQLPTRQVIVSDGSRQLEVYRALLDKAVRSGDVDSQMGRLQQIGDKLLELDQPRPAEAIEAFDQALLLARGRNAPALRINALAQGALRARLRTRTFSEAVAFFASLVKESTSYYDDLMPVFKDELSILSGRTSAPNRGADVDAAMALIDAMLAMDPPLPSRYQNDFRDEQRDLRDRRSRRNDITQPNAPYQGIVRVGTVADERPTQRNPGLRQASDAGV